MSPPHTPPSRDRVLRLLEKMRGVRVVVLGDAMLDRYLLGDTDRLSPEAPVPVVTVKETRAALGGAANVAANVVAIGARCHLVATAGDDLHGRAFREALGAAGLDDRTIVTVPGRPTTTKTRVMARGQQVVRIDEEVDAPLEPGTLERVTTLLHEALADADALLLEDYNKGLLAAPLITAAVAAALRRGVPVVVDPKYRHFFEYAGATVFKPNRRELEAALGAAVDLEHRDALPQALERLKVDNLLLTLGADGMVLVTKAREIIHLPSIAREVYDVSGAGDTVTAWVGAALAAGATLLEAATLANYAAGIEVGKAGVATVTPEELLAVHEERFDQVGMLRRGGML